MPRTAKDLSGQTFGKWIVLERDPDNSRVAFRCRCECGHEAIILSDNLRSGNSTRCIRCGRGRKAIDMTGQRFGALVAESRTDRRRGHFVMWLCRCDCGNRKVIGGQDLRRGSTNSCGCGIHLGRVIAGCPNA